MITFTTVPRIRLFVKQNSICFKPTHCLFCYTLPMPDLHPVQDGARSLSIWKIILIVMSIKAYLFLLVFLFQLFFPVIFNMDYYTNHFHWPPDQSPGLSAPYMTWDGQHYLFLSRYGYQQGMISSAFYPLWPWMIRMGSLLTGGNHLAAGLIFSNLLSLAGLVLFYRFVMRESGDKAASHSLWLLLCYPGSIFFLFCYSESLFFFLVLLFFTFLFQRKYPGASLAAFLLPLTKAIGVFTVLPYVYFMARLIRSGEEKRPLRLAWALSPLAGYALYFLIMSFATGDPMEGFRAQGLFIADSTIGKILDLPGFLSAFFSIDLMHTFLESPLDRIWFLLFVLSLVSLFKRNRTLFWFALPMGIIPAMTVQLMAFTRYLLIIFPVFMVYGTFLSEKTSPLIKKVLILVLVLLQHLFLILHTNNYWVG